MLGVWDVREAGLQGFRIRIRVHASQKGGGEGGGGWLSVWQL